MSTYDGGGHVGTIKATGRTLSLGQSPWPGEKCPLLNVDGGTGLTCGFQAFVDPFFPRSNLSVSVKIPAGSASSFIWTIETLWLPH